MNEAERVRSKACDEVNSYLNSLYARHSPEITIELMKFVSKHGITLEEFILWSHKREVGKEEFRIEQIDEELRKIIK